MIVSGDISALFINFGSLAKSWMEDFIAMNSKDVFRSWVAILWRQQWLWSFFPVEERTSIAAGFEGGIGFGKFHFALDGNAVKVLPLVKFSSQIHCHSTNNPLSFQNPSKLFPFELNNQLRPEICKQWNVKMHKFRLSPVIESIKPLQACNWYRFSALFVLHFFVLFQSSPGIERGANKRRGPGNCAKLKVFSIRSEAHGLLVPLNDNLLE